MAFSYTVNAFTDAETPNSLTYTATFSDDKGLQFDPVTRVISGTFTTIGRTIVTITATDPNSLLASTIFTIYTPCDNPSPDYAALVDLYNATNGSTWASSWLTTCNPCNWLGIGCDNSGRVVGIYSSGVKGTIPSSISQLSNLEYLHLFEGKLTGDIPVSIGQLSQLKSLLLYKNQLSGNIPASIGQLSNLTVLDLASNQLGGTIPTELSMLTQLRYLSLSSNRLSGNIPASLGQLSSLAYAYLANNQLSGSIPASIGRLPVLQGLDCRSNQLSGSIPGTLGSLLQIQSIDFSYNNLSGCFLDSLSSLCGKYVYFSNNPGLPGGGDFDAFCTSGIGSCFPRPTKNANQPALVGTPFSYSINSFIDTAPSASLTYSANLIPANGFIFDPATRIISGTPISTGVTNVTITVTNPDGQSATTSFTIAACTPNSEFAVLADLYRSTNGNNWTNKTNWFSSCSPCDWYGITCNRNGRISLLGLYDNNLNGSIPTSLSLLSELESLILDRNQLRGSIPAGLGQLSMLNDISLRFNQLSGSIPPSLTQLIHLHTLNLGDNQLSGSLPDALDQLIQLDAMFLQNNQLNGSIPASLSRLNKLRILLLQNNQLSGCFPSSLTVLCGRSLNFSNNPDLPGGGDFPAFCANGTGSCSAPQPIANSNQTATRNTAFSYTANAFTDLETPNSLTYTATISPTNGLNFDPVSRIISGIPTSAGAVSVTITAVDPSGLSGYTNFTIIVNCDTFSPDYVALVDLYNATNGSNWYNKSNWLTGCDPCNWYGVSCTNGRVTGLGLRSNQLSGSIPESLSALTNLQILYLDGNRLTGSIPANLGTLSNLTNLDLHDNQLSGSIPESLSALSNLSSFIISRNPITGSIPESFSALTNLVQLSISYCQLSGSIPTGLGNLTNILFLELNNNQLSGELPASLGNLTKLFFLYLNDNQLSGCFAKSLRSLCNRVVALYNNPNLPGGGNFSDFCINNTGICSDAMPVNLTSFLAQAANNQVVELTWKTVSEYDNDYFLLERSKDLNQIETLSKIKAHEGGSFQGYTYTYTDEKPYNGTSYYRLRQVDVDGTTTTYSWESVIIRQQAYGVSPNPVSNQQFSLQLDEPLTATINLYTLEGHPVSFQKVGNKEGSLQLKTEQKLPVGVYILTVEERAQTRQYRIVVE